MACARVDLDEPSRLSVIDACRKGVDWGRLLTAARYHEIEPLVFRHLSGAGCDTCPPVVLEALRAESRRTSVWNLALAAEAAAVFERFRSEGIRAVLLKGPVAAVAYYGDLGLRRFLDIDVLVEQERALDAWRLLSERRYAHKFSLGIDGEAHLVRHGSELLFRDASGRFVDLHWNIWPPGFTFTPGSEAPWKDREFVQLGTANVETLGCEATVLFFCLHGAKHNWAGLKWVTDLAELVRARPTLRWGRVLDWSARPGRRVLIDLGLHLAHRLLGAPVPPDVLARGASDSRVEGLVDEAIRGILGFDAPPRWLLAEIWNALYRRAMSSRADQLRYLHDALLAPTPHEWELVPLPAALFPLYYGLRPIRLAWKHSPLGRLFSRRRRSSWE
ncbi:MAG TPA: nucleotidyltransferase family protein [Thermoanaerobaculaceae bacterium]|nr:nucleotidyltransferase family protein [Thermoanaerobaculaceae bacterium]